jgi:DNA-binding GntR family transcriptional regulator
MPVIISQLSDVQTALEKRDAEKPRQLMEEHVRYFIDHIKSQLL